MLYYYYKRKKKVIREEFPDEIWRSVPGSGGFYEISSIGRLRSIARQRSSGYSLPELITWGSGKDGEYKRFVMYMPDGTKKHKRIHQLVAFLFVDNPDGKKCVNHLDGNKSNNAWWNLEWNTHAENNEHARRTGLTIPYQKISNQTVASLRASDLSNKELSIKHQIDYRYVWAIRKSKARLLQYVEVEK